jgi:hypothetical protein
MFIFLRSPHCNSGICPDVAQTWQSPHHRSQPPVHNQLPPKNSFIFGEKMEVRRRQVRTVGGMVKVYPTKFLQQLYQLSCSVCSYVVMKHTPLDGHPDCTTLCTSVLPPLNRWHHLRTFPSFMTTSPYTSTSWWWILAGQMFFVFKNQINHWTHHTTGWISDWHGSL